jgi:DMSO/TMAO reductase YedYZ molybdopterin-dependent catalytic subunit
MSTFGIQRHVSRRRFVGIGAAGAAAMGWLRSSAAGVTDEPNVEPGAATPETFFTPPDKFQDVSRGKPLPHSLSDEQKQAVGLTRDTWRMEVLADPQQPARLRRPMTHADGSAFTFQQLMDLAANHAVRFPKLMTCLNLGCPLGMGLWEGVPLREVVWRTEPRENLRRVVYWGYHNDDPEQLFRSSLPIGRVLEDYYDLPPVILCYKLNGQWLDGERGGPVRLVVPEAYGFKSIKWLTHVALSNLPHANDTYADGNNDLDSPLKTFAGAFPLPNEVPSQVPIPVTGYAQVGISGLSRVQVLFTPADLPPDKDDPHFQTAPWTDARILPPPADWGGGLAEGKIPAGTMGFDPASGRPRTWPMRLCKVHWAAEVAGAPPGKYVLRCRTIDEKGIAQPLPRSFRKSGHAAIEERPVTVV